MTPAEQAKMNELEQMVQRSLEANATLLERINRLETFITKGQDEWDTDDLMLAEDDLESTIKNIVERNFWVSVSAEFRANK